jgi:hypothetical protein
MTEENKFQRNVAKTNAIGNPENSDSDVVLPVDEDIDKRFRSLDEVTEHFAQEQLLGPNTHRSVLDAAQLAKQGKSDLVRPRSESKSKSRE